MDDVLEHSNVSTRPQGKKKGGMIVSQHSGVSREILAHSLQVWLTLVASSLSPSCAASSVIQSVPVVLLHICLHSSQYVWHSIVAESGNGYRVCIPSDEHEGLMPFTANVV